MVGVEEDVLGVVVVEQDVVHAFLKVQQTAGRVYVAAGHHARLVVGHGGDAGSGRGHQAVEEAPFVILVRVPGGTAVLLQRGEGECRERTLEPVEQTAAVAVVPAPLQFPLGDDLGADIVPVLPVIVAQFLAAAGQQQDGRGGQQQDAGEGMTGAADHFAPPFLLFLRPISPKRHTRANESFSGPK